MTHTVTTTRKPYRDGGSHLGTVVADVDITSYTASGETPAAADFGLRTLEAIECGVTDNGFIVRFDGTKFRAFAPLPIADNDTPSANSVDLAAADAGLEATTTGNADLFLPGAEVPATTDVGAFRVLARGY